MMIMILIRSGAGESGTRATRSRAIGAPCKITEAPTCDTSKPSCASSSLSHLTHSRKLAPHLAHVGPSPSFSTNTISLYIYMCISYIYIYIYI